MVSLALRRLFTGGLITGAIAAQLAMLGVKSASAGGVTPAFTCGDSFYSYGMMTYIDCPTANELRVSTSNGPACLHAYRKSTKEFIWSFYPREFIQLAVGTSDTHRLYPGTITLTRPQGTSYIVEIEIPGIPSNDIAIYDMKGDFRCD